MEKICQGTKRTNESADSTPQRKDRRNLDSNQQEKETQRPYHITKDPKHKPNTIKKRHHQCSKCNVLERAKADVRYVDCRCRQCNLSICTYAMLTVRYSPMQTV